MSITTYANLKTAIQNWSKRTDTLDVLDDFIDLAEADMWLKLRIRDMEARATATADGRYLGLPDNFIDMRRLVLVSGNNYYQLEQRTPDAMLSYPSAGRPGEFSVTTQIEFNKVPDSSYTVQMDYWRQLTPLSSSNTSNAILERFPMIYLYGALFHFAQWAQDDKMLMKYSDLFDGQMVRANLMDRRGRHGPSPAMKKKGATP